MQQFLIAFLFLFLTANQLQAQIPSRSGQTAPQESKAQLRGFPCGGTPLSDEGFEDTGLPLGWAAVDGDNLPPKAEIQFLFPQGGWQSIVDFKDSTNRAFASPSWYEDSLGQSNDWLISPQQITVAASVCLSWYAYSQDPFFPESYEVRVSTTTPDEAGFLAEPVLVTVAAEGSVLNYRSTSLDQYNGQDIYIAFRHTTTDGFALVLDDVLMAQVDGFDLALYRVPQVDADTGDSYLFTGAVINLGLDTVVLDSNQLKISYQIDNGDIQIISIADSFALLPNDTIQFQHDSAWVPIENKVYRVSLWIDGFGADDVPSNDTIGRWQGIGTTTAIEPVQAVSPINIYPNPTRDQLHIIWEGQSQANLSIELLDLTGRSVRPQAKLQNSSHEFSLVNLPNGIYLLRVKDTEGNSWTERVLKW